MDTLRYGRCVDQEPCNAAADRIRLGLTTWHEPASMKAAWNEHHSEDFVRIDRRRLIAGPDADRRQHLENQLLWFELGDGQPTFGVEILAVRGERLALCRASVGYANQEGREALSVVTYDRSVEKATKHIHFDLDDLDSAIAELDRQHAEIGVEGA